MNDMNSSASALAGWTPEQIEQGRQWVATWRRAGAALEQIRRAEGDVQRAKSTHAAAHSGYARLKEAADSHAGLVAQQEVDDSLTLVKKRQQQINDSLKAVAIIEKKRGLVRGI